MNKNEHEQKMDKQKNDHTQAMETIKANRDLEMKKLSIQEKKLEMEIRNKTAGVRVGNSSKNLLIHFLLIIIIALLTILLQILKDIQNLLLTCFGANKVPLCSKGY